MLPSWNTLIKHSTLKIKTLNKHVNTIKNNSVGCEGIVMLIDK